MGKSLKLEKDKTIYVPNKGRIQVTKSRLINELMHKIGEESSFNLSSSLADDKTSFRNVCNKIEWNMCIDNYVENNELMELYALVDPVHGGQKDSQNIEADETKFLQLFCKLMKVNKFKVITKDDWDNASSTAYRLNYTVKVDDSRLDNALVPKKVEPILKAEGFLDGENSSLPRGTYIVFHRGTGFEETRACFLALKRDVLFQRFRNWLSKVLRLTKKTDRTKLETASEEGIESGRTELHLKQGGSEQNAARGTSNGSFQRDLVQFKRIGIRNVFLRVTVKEATYDQVIVLYRLHKHAKKHGDHGKKRGAHGTTHGVEHDIHLKHYASIPLAELEVVIPETKNPQLPVMDRVLIVLSAITALVGILETQKLHRFRYWIIAAILFIFFSYCIDVYRRFHSNWADYQRRINKSMNQKQLGSGQGTLLHVCNEALEQKIKEAVIACFLMKYYDATEQELGRKCNDLLGGVFSDFKDEAVCDIYMRDAVRNLKKLNLLEEWLYQGI